jgi:hypothetical protein
MKEELYKKEGRKYIRVNDPWAYEGLWDGFHLVWIRPGSVTIREPVYPAKQELLAAIEIAREAMEKALLEANKMRPSEKELTPQEQKAWEAYQEIAGEDSLTLYGLSISDIVDAGIKALKDYKDY